MRVCTGPPRAHEGHSQAWAVGVTGVEARHLLTGAQPLAILLVLLLLLLPPGQLLHLMRRGPRG